MLNRISNLSPRHAWSLWLAILFITVAVHSLTLTISPTIWQDEVEIVDYGRTALWGSDQGWSVNWSVKGRPVLAFNYLGCVLQELACRLTAMTEVGPRLASVLGAIFAGTAMLGWFLKRGVKPIAALASASLLLLDPVFAQSYRGARVDCWVFGFIFLTCWLIWLAMAVEGRSGRLRLNLFLVAAGVCLALAGLCWPSAILLVPLVMHEFFSAFRVRFTRKHMVLLLYPLLTLAGSAFVTLLLFLAPVCNSIMAALQDLNNVVSITSGHASVLSGMQAVAESYRLSPWLLLLGLVSFVIPANRLLGVAFVLALLGVIATHPYIHRALYLLPYLLLGFSGIIALLMIHGHSRPVFLKASLAALAILLVWSSALTLGMRTWNALRQREFRSPDRLMEVAQSSIGKQAVSVYTHPSEFYYVGRRLGWRQFNFIDADVARNPGILANILPQMQYVILREGEPGNSQIQEILAQKGFKLLRKIQAGGNRLPAKNGSTQIGYGATGYGEYLIYVSGSLPAADRQAPRVGTNSSSL